MTRYLRRHAIMGTLSLLALGAVAVARHASPICYIVIAGVGTLQAVIVRALDRRMQR
jgi:hypothetical protein